MPRHPGSWSTRLTVSSVGAPELSGPGWYVLTRANMTVLLDPGSTVGGRAGGGPGHQIHVGADDRAHHGVTAAGDGIAVQDDRLGAAGNLDGPDGIAGIHDVGRIGAGAEWLLPLLPLHPG